MGEVTPLTRAQRLLAVGLVLGVTLVAFEVTAVVTAMPTIADVLDGDSLFGLASASYTLATMVALVAAGELADRRGAALPYLLSIGTFIAGLALAAAAPSMVWVVIARTMQGIGSGGLAPIAYTLVQRAFPVERHATMFAVLSAGWVLPSLFAPAVSGLLVDTVGWRWVFLGIIPLAVLVAALATPPMRHFGPTTSERPPTRIGHAVVAAAGIGALATGVRADSVWLAVPLTLVGAVLGLRALRHLLPSGTGRGSRGLPAILASRLLATATFMGVDAFVPLGVARIHGASPTVQGFVIIGAAVTWSIGSALVSKMPNLRPQRSALTGFAFIAVGIASTSLVVSDSWPLWTTFLTWCLAGFGMGLLFIPTSVDRKSTRLNSSH